MSMSDAERIKFIQGLDIPASSRATNESAAVAAGSIISFVSDVPSQMKADVLNSTLLAQLAADTAYNRQEQTKEWYEHYKAILENVGWAAQSFDFVYLSDASSYLTVNNLVTQLAAREMSGNELALFRTMVESLRDDANQAAETLFDSSSKALNKANFQLGVTSNSSGNATLKLGVYTYTASRDIDHVLFFAFNSQKVPFYVASQVMVLDERVYAVFRAAVLDKLGKEAVNKIKDLQI